jgi:hypothetical protein
MIKDLEKYMNIAKKKTEELAKLNSSLKKSINNTIDDPKAVEYLEGLMVKAMKGEQPDLEELNNKIKEFTDASRTDNTK